MVYWDIYIYSWGLNGILRCAMKLVWWLASGLVTVRTCQLNEYKIGSKHFQAGYMLHQIQGYRGDITNQHGDIEYIGIY